MWRERVTNQLPMQKIAHNVLLAKHSGAVAEPHPRYHYPHHGRNTGKLLNPNHFDFSKLSG